MNTIRDKIISIVGTFLLTCFLVLIFVLSLRGINGSPTEATLNDPLWKDEGPLELSPDRGRFALTYSIVENKSFQFSLPIARFTAPDVAYSNGHYLSLFAPALSFFLIPGYILGKLGGISQVGTFAMVSVVAIVNFFLIRAIVVNLGGRKIAGTVAGIAFIFATPAFAYGVTLYQHHFSSLIVLLSTYLLTKSKSLWAIGLVWFLTTLSVSLDNPNAIFMFPLALFAFTKLFELDKFENVVKLKFRYLGVHVAALALIPVVLFMSFNLLSNGDAFKLSGTLPTATFNEDSKLEDNNTELQNKPKTKSVVGAFKTRNLINGIYIHTISPDRGTIFFAPVVLFSIFGFLAFPKTKGDIKAIIVATAGAIFILYSLWGDPAGGWAFGSRYMIPAYALLCVLLGIGLESIFKRWYIGILFILVFIFSVSINTLGALTTNRNPPKVEAIPLQQISNRIEKYSFDRNWEFLLAGRSKSFIYQTYLSKSLTTQQYYYIVLVLVAYISLVSIFIFWITKNKQL